MVQRRLLSWHWDMAQTSMLWIVLPILLCTFVLSEYLLAFIDYNTHSFFMFTLQLRIPLSDDNTLLYTMPRYGFGETLGKYLISKGADRSLRNTEGRTYAEVWVLVTELKGHFLGVSGSYWRLHRLFSSALCGFGMRTLRTARRMSQTNEYKRTK